MKKRKWFNYKPYIQSLVEFINKKYTIKPYPLIKLSNRNQKGNSMLIKTGYYDPSQNLILIFTKNRNPKDVMRSLAHELIHHYQNLENRLTNDDYNGEKITEDDRLLRLEGEAYFKGNLIFRQWTESLEKNFIFDPTTIMHKKFHLTETQIKTLKTIKTTNEKNS